MRALSLADGTELARQETELLGGFSSSPAVYGDGLFVAGVDGVGFVLDARTLERLHRFGLAGASRTALLATPRGVLVCDDRGTMRLLDRDGGTVWEKETSTITVDAALAPLQPPSVVQALVEARVQALQAQIPTWASATCQRAARAAVCARHVALPINGLPAISGMCRRPLVFSRRIDAVDGTHASIAVDAVAAGERHHRD